jgi:hypothetical protein
LSNRFNGRGRIAPGSEGIVPSETRRARDARAPFRFTQARCPQRLPWVRAPPARMPARICLRRAGGRDARAPFRFTRARRPRSVQVHGCVRLRRAYQQRLPWVRAPPARISAAPAPGARASGAHISSACPGCARLRRACARDARTPSGCSSRIAPGSEGIVPSETRRTRDARALSRLNITPRTHNS